MAGNLGRLALQRERWFYLLISPWLIGFLAFQLAPMMGVFWLAFHEWHFPKAPYFVGSAHFAGLMQDTTLRHTLFNTLYYAAGTVPSGIALGLLLALLLNRPGRGVNGLRAIFFLPVVISGVATTLLWGWVFNPKYGLINHLLGLLGVRGPGWFYDPHWAMPALILMSLWNVGVDMVVYLAALQNIPHELHEAATLDGAGNWSRFWHVTWPLISPATFYLLIVNVIAAFQVFTPTYLLTRGGPEQATLTLPLYIYLNAFSYGKMGYATALSLLAVLVILVFTGLQFRLARGWVFYLGGRAP
jgi:multiple sugar transport system permease protein